MQAAGQQEKLLKHQPPPRDLQRFGRGREVDIFICVVDITQIVFLPDIVGQHILQQFAALVQTLPHSAGHNQLGDTGGEGIKGHNAPCDLLLTLPLQQRVDHLTAQQVTLYLAIENISFALVEGVFAVFLIEKHQVQRAAIIHGAGFHQ